GKISDEGVKGPNALIRDGAYPALCADDILKHYGFLYGDTLDRKRFEKAKKSKKSSEESLRRYQMLYAIGDEDEKEEILTPKKKCKESSKKQESVMTSTEK
ncbi:MAG: hypothetical protein IKB23_07980, partial [Clostridia bacterium]|nr:hypothetical protein [Clostridia bacterium]